MLQILLLHTYATSIVNRAISQKKKKKKKKKRKKKLLTEPHYHFENL